MTHQDTDQTTSYHALTKPHFLKDEWDHDYYELVDAVDANLKMSDTLANRPSASNVPTGAWFEATDEGLIYRNDSNDGWVVIGFGTASSPVPAAYIDSLTVTDSSGDAIASFESPNQSGSLTLQDADGEFNFDSPVNVNGNTVWDDSNFDPSTKLDTSNPTSSGIFSHGGNFKPDFFRSADVKNASNGQAIVSNGDGTFSMESVGSNEAVEVADAPNGNIQTVELENTESTEISVSVPPGKTLTVYRWGCYNITNSTAPTGLRVQLLADDDSVIESENTVNSRDTLNGVAWSENTSSNMEVHKLRIYNGTGNTHQVGGFFGYIVE